MVEVTDLNPRLLLPELSLLTGDMSGGLEKHEIRLNPLRSTRKNVELVCDQLQRALWLRCSTPKSFVDLGVS
jgi:hypothetical protein